MAHSHHSLSLNSPLPPPPPPILIRRRTRLYALHPRNSSLNPSPSNWNGLKFTIRTKLLSELGTWGIGGPCNHFVQVFDQSQLIAAIRYCKERSLRFIVVGKGSNCLFDDLGFDGCVILNRIQFLERIEPGVYRAGSGYPFNRLGVECSNEGFSGLEFAGGIPGTVGGAAYMNAGAKGQETAEVVDNVEFVTTDGNFWALNKADIEFRYRWSLFRDMKDLGAIVGVTFRLKHSKWARRDQQEFLDRRKMSQPLQQQSAGSVFRNPSDLGLSAANLIDRAGLKGLRVGGAMVSPVHANFFINVDRSSSKDMLELIGLVKEKVHQKFGVKLKEEIVYVHP